MTASSGQDAPRGLAARLKALPLAHLGPGLITGVADDDPSGVATYTQAGAQYGLAMLWTMPLCFPLMAGIQAICARIGRVTGRGLAANLGAALPKGVVRPLIGLLLVANILNISADVAAMGEIGELTTGVNRHVMTVLFVAVTIGLQLLVPYHQYVRYLKWLCLSLLAYAAVLFTVRVPWSQVALQTLAPHFTLDRTSAAVIVGVFGTTISPYLFFWQASEEVEDMERDGARPLTETPDAAPVELTRIRWDTWSGMFYSDVSAFFIILASAVTLHAGGRTDVQTAYDAALALKPVAGPAAALLFSLGLLGVGLIGVPVLAGSGAYALAETLGWRGGLERTLGEAPAFYAVIALSVLVGVGLQFTPINPMKALFWSAVFNGVAAVPLMVAVMAVVAKRSVMGPFVAGRGLLALGWTATGVMAIAAGCLFLPQ